MIILDTGGLYAFLDTDDAHHRAARMVVEAEPGPFILSPFVLAELDHLVQRRLGNRAASELLSDVESDVYTLVTFGSNDLSDAVAVVNQYQALGIGITDASVAARGSLSNCGPPVRR